MLSCCQAGIDQPTQIGNVPERDAVIEKVVKVLRLARGAGTEAEAQTALALAQRLMYAHDIAESELDPGPEPQSIDDRVIEETGAQVAWKEYLGAVIAENFRCAYIVSVSRSTGAVRLVLVGRRDDAAVAVEAYQTSVYVASHLAGQCAAARAPADQAGARASFLTGFLKGLYDRFQESASSTALVRVANPDVIAHATALTNAGLARGGELSSSDGSALREGIESGYAHAAGRRFLDD